MIFLNLMVCWKLKIKFSFWFFNEFLQKSIESNKPITITILNQTIFVSQVTRDTALIDEVSTINLIFSKNKLKIPNQSNKIKCWNKMKANNDIRYSLAFNLT